MLLALLKAMRPKQWAKNAFVFAGVFFDGQVLSAPRLFASIGAFVIFSLVSGAIYLINDLADIDNDRLHPRKRHRPLASGALSAPTAKVVAVGLLAIMLPISFALHPGFGVTVLAYAAMMIAYSLALKHVVIIDVMVIAAGFVLRVLGGAQVAQVARFSPWLYVCTTLLALFIALNKRRHELMTLAENANNHRSVLEGYSISFIDNCTSVVTAVAIMAYSLYTFSASNLPADNSMMLTIPFVLYGIFRYLYLVHVQQTGGTPEDIVLHDRPLLAAIALWVITAGLVIYTPVFR